MATVNVLRCEVATLNNKIVELKRNIVEFHTYVRGLVNDFAAYGAKCDELQANVFWAYLAVDDD
jgi:hypothetical protein